jgi:hypothetical protein
MNGKSNRVDRESSRRLIEKMVGMVRDIEI